MSSTIHYQIARNDGKQITGSYWDGEYKRAPGLEVLVEEDRRILLEVQKDCNTKIGQIEAEAHTALGRFSWDSSYTRVDPTNDNRVALLLFHAILKASKRLPHLTFDFHDSHFFDVFYEINNGQLVALPEVEIDDDLFSWEYLEPEERNHHLGKARGKFSYLASLDPIQDTAPHQPSTRKTDFYYLLQDVTINPDFVLKGKGSRFLTVHYSNEEDVAKNGKTNFDNLGAEVVTAMREGIAGIRKYLESQDLSGIGGSETPYEVSEGMCDTARQFEQLLEGEKPEKRGSKLHKYRIELIVTYDSKHEKDLHKVTYWDPPKLEAECIYSAERGSETSGITFDCKLGIPGATKEMNVLSSNLLRKIKNALGKNKDIEGYQVKLAIYHQPANE